MTDHKWNLPEGVEIVPGQCEHGDSVWDEDHKVCLLCSQVLYVLCPLCGGDGVIDDASTEWDWAQSGDCISTCPECGGAGYTNDPSFQ